MTNIKHQKIDDYGCYRIPAQRPRFGIWVVCCANIGSVSVTRSCSSLYVVAAPKKYLSLSTLKGSMLLSIPSASAPLNSLEVDRLPSGLTTEVRRISTIHISHQLKRSLHRMRIDQLELDRLHSSDDPSKTILRTSNTSDHHTLSDKLISESLESIESDRDRLGTCAEAGRTAYFSQLDILTECHTQGFSHRGEKKVHRGEKKVHW